MKKHILVGTGLLLTLGTAVAGSLMYGQGSSTGDDQYAPTTSLALEQPSPATIEMWKATADSVRLHRAESSDLSRRVMRVTGLCSAQLRGGCRQLTTDLRTVR